MKKSAGIIILFLLTLAATAQKKTISQLKADIERSGNSPLYVKDVLKKKFSGWNVYILTADPLLPKLIRLTASRRTPLFNGALECRLLEYKMVAGGMRRVKKPPLSPPAPGIEVDHG
jgi:hypothetical protein